MSDKVAETWITAPKRLFSAASQEACLVHIYPDRPEYGVPLPAWRQFADTRSR